ncbi:hypothetical protein ACIRVF_31675 [Kitasatospora sp. NPDC101157]|uniref:hypothetical protein n=1 Tax=Kitasatospora sp. NPDC101157 TaxID=3364098 RepID=UPI0038027B84
MSEAGVALPRELLFEKIRRDRRQDPTVSGRQLALRYKVSRNTVAEALRSPVPKKRKKPEPRLSVLEPVKARIDEMLWADLEAPRKQRHTIERIKVRLAVEFDFDLASYSTIRDYVAGGARSWRPWPRRGGGTWTARSRRPRHPGRRRRSTSRTSGWTWPGSG